MGKKCLLAILCCFAGTFLLSGQTVNNDMESFRNDKFGMFIHWGLYSLPAGEWKGNPSRGGEHFMLYERIPLKEYAMIADGFDPVDFDAEKWVQTAKHAGMRYIVYTTKHHDGFAMYDSQCSDYNIVKRTPFKRDPLKELAEACKKHGMKLGLYYSIGRDWEDPDVPTDWPEKAGRSNTWDYPDEDAKVLSRYLERKAKPQIRELLTGYGDIDMMWFDTPEMVTREQSREIRELIKSLQPHCLINSRIGNGMGDYSIIEQRLMDKIDDRPWEACLTMGRNWGYNKFDTLYKNPEELIRHLADIVSKGGNMLLNVGPTGKGDFPVFTEPGLETYHEWLKVNGEAIYGTRPWKVFGEDMITGNNPEINANTDYIDSEFDGTPKDRMPDFRFTSKNGSVYVIVRNVEETGYTIRSIAQDIKVRSVKLLENGEIVDWVHTDEGMKIELPRAGKPQFPIYVLKIESDTE